MELIKGGLLAAVAALAVIAVIYTVKELLLTPRGGRALVVIPASGDGLRAESTARAMAWVRDSGRAELTIVLLDGGLTGEGRYRAETIAERVGGFICPPDEIQRMIEEYVWRMRDT